MPDNRSYQEQARAGISPNKMRSESTQNELARRELQNTPPVSVLQDLLARFQAAGGDPAGNQYNSLIDAIRERAADEMKRSGDY